MQLTADEMTLCVALLVSILAACYSKWAWLHRETTHMSGSSG